MVIYVKKTIIVVIILMLISMIFYPVVTSGSVDESGKKSEPKISGQPLLQIVITSDGGRGFPLCAEITNLGNETATGLQISVELSGFIFVGHINLEDYTRDRLEPGETWTVCGAAGLFFGIGPLTITMSVSYNEADEPAEASITVFMLGPLILGLN